MSVTTSLFLLYLYVVTCPVSHIFKAPLFSLFTFLPAYEMISSDDQESPGRGTNLSAALFLFTFHSGVPVSHLQ